MMAEQREIELLKSRILRLNSELHFYKEHHARCNCVAERPATPIGPGLQAVRSPSPPLSESRRSFTSPQPEELVVIPYTASSLTLANNKRCPKPPPERPSKKRTKREVTMDAFIADVHNDAFDTRTALTSVKLSEPGESTYKRGTMLVERTLKALRQSADADTTARAELFFFLSSLSVLERLEVLSEDDVQGLMQKLEGKVSTVNHQRRVRDGALWFHEKIISELCKQGWTLHHAISVVAPRAPRRAYVYDDISHSKNIIPIIEAFQSVKEPSRGMEDLGSLFLQYICYWQPSISQKKIRQLLYPTVSSLEFPSVSHPPSRNEPQIISLEVSPQSLETASTSLIIPDQSIISTPVTLQSSLYPPSNHISNVALAQLHEEPVTRLRLGNGYQQSEEIVPYIVSATSLISAAEPPNVESYIANLGPQLQLWNQREVPDTAQSIWFAMNGNIEGLKYLFNRRLASPKDVSYTRRYSLVRVVGSLRRNVQLCNCKVSAQSGSLCG
ncbi:hypothetical protein T440DRAFT_126549 [Plenodomus tracheiphilus IPT5]|uniref:Uncharacterized protein n=1 Tax=Plenodomus tracheiphilus IPT5 TaxID=1408161 RepID=A0A6A7B4R5_9PLEO|nr:hypothetical protein T440DRAFT_126549 [Plenodomus tracheiphilus IPT5]